MPKDNEFAKVSAKKETKREIQIIAASEERHEYELVEDMLKLYKAVVIKKTARLKNIKNVPVAEFISSH
jgi:hypothetical protein